MAECSLSDAFRPIQVHGASLDPDKQWFFLEKEVCGVRPRDYAKNYIFTRFPSEIQYIQRKELYVRRNGDTRTLEVSNCQKQPSHVYVTSTFGLLVGILRQREFPANGFEGSYLLKSAFRSLNKLDLESENDKTPSQRENTTYISTTLYTVKLNNLSAQIAKLEEELAHYKKSAPEMQVPAISSSADEVTRNDTLGSTTRKKMVALKCENIFSSLKDICAKHKESISSVLGHFYVTGAEKEKDEVRNIISEVFNRILESKSNKNGIWGFFSDDVSHKILCQMRVPDWALLYFKLKTRLPDSAWQTMLNVTHLGRSGRNSDTPILITKNQVKAIKALIFKVVRQTLNVNKMNTSFDACCVDLPTTLVWAIREHRLYASSDQSEIEFNIKIDGRPLGGNYSLN
ncbi:uncharacterized protein LOC116307600 [Actinia tenebrosa]|uniref:Uncharacterized protein LOC116307600 n=1 Tax=Actinia tenebrosa TaxID=6105 RepID=A0A6P8J1E5_ACTTE|nr:uncharacterized protein LOC116307600 [Actinia tenebrosa]